MFKEGDILRCVRDYHSETNGHIRVGDTVLVIDPSPGSLVLFGRRLSDGMERGWNKDRFERVSTNLGDD